MSHLYIHARDLRVLGSGAVSWLGGGSVIQPETHLAPGSVCMSDHPETSLSLLMPWWLLHRTCFSIRWVRALAETPASEDRHRGRQLMTSQQPCCTVGQQPLSQRVEAPLALLQIDTAEGRAIQLLHTEKDPLHIGTVSWRLGLHQGRWWVQVHGWDWGSIPWWGGTWKARRSLSSSTQHDVCLGAGRWRKRQKGKIRSFSLSKSQNWELHHRI